jgi:hypothetical protein
VQNPLCELGLQSIDSHSIPVTVARTLLVKARVSATTLSIVNMNGVWERGREDKWYRKYRGHTALERSYIYSPRQARHIVKQILSIVRKVICEKLGVIAICLVGERPSNTNGRS